MNEFNPKRALLDTLSQHYDIRPIRGSDIVALNSKAVLYIRYNKNKGSTKRLLGRFWFGITQSEYERYSGENLFIVCACVFRSDEVDYLVFPSDIFNKIKEDIALRSGQWKFNLLKTTEKRYLLQISNKGKHDVTSFLNYFDFSPREIRKVVSPPLGEFLPKVVKTEGIPTTNAPTSIEEELLLASKDSTNPRRFELALERFFSKIGFRCKSIGGPGDTDILVLDPVRFIVDGKITTRESKPSINFTRIKRHMKENQAEFMVIVSVGFAPAVTRDAEMEGATLIDIHTIVDVLRIQQEYPISPFDYIDILRKPGMVTPERLRQLQAGIEFQSNLLKKSAVLLCNLDFMPRNTDEIKGRTDLYCEQHRLDKIKGEEIESLLLFLSHDCLGVVKCLNAKYSSLFTPPLAIEKLKIAIRVLCFKSLELEKPTTPSGGEDVAPLPVGKGI
jgi:hypothetical protein